jgi:hypothetical protein
MVARGDAGSGGNNGGSSSHGAGKRAGRGGDRGDRGHADSHVTSVSRGGYDAPHRIEEIRRKKSSTAGENDGFPTFSARLRNLLLLEKFKPLGITKYDVKQDLVQWLRCHALSIENAGGNNDTKCLYFPFCLDQAPSHGSNPSRSTQLTSGTSSRTRSLETSWAPRDTRVLAWTCPW